MFHFQWPWLFALLPLPWLVWRFLRPVSDKGEAALFVPFFDQLQGLQTRTAGREGWASAWWVVLIWVLLVSASARPQWLGEPVALPQAGRDIMLAVDISGSMQKPDMALKGLQVNRLEVVKDAAGEFVQRRVGDRLGLILFGTRAYLQTPLTFDRETVRQMLQETVVGLAGPETAIGDSIGLAVKRLREAGTKDKVLILLSDGANTAGVLHPLQAARLAAQAGLRIYTIGLGARSLRVPGFLGSRTVNPSADLDEALLKEVAEVTGGQYFRATDRASLEEIYRQLDRLEPRVSDRQVFRPSRSLYYWPLGGALVLSLAPAVMFLLPGGSRRRSHGARVATSLVD